MASRIEDPLISRFILPEQQAMHEQYHKEQKLIPKPDLDENELEEFCYKITDSRQYDYSLTCELGRATKGDRGVIETAWGWIDKFDSQFKQIKLKNDEDFWWIPVEDVISVEA